MHSRVVSSVSLGGSSRREGGGRGERDEGEERGRGDEKGEREGR